MNQFQQKRIEQIAGISVVVFLVLGCFLVLRPFISSLLWGGILCYTTWPFYVRINQLLRGRHFMSALIMTLCSAFVLIAPFLVVSISFAENIQNFIGLIAEWWQKGIPQAPAWIDKIPWVGGYLHSYWNELAEHAGLFNQLMKKTLSQSQVRHFFVSRSLDLGYGVFQLAMSVFISFFLYRDGEKVINMISEGMRKIAGTQTQQYLTVIGKTVRSVVVGIIGTALIQGVLAGFAFWISPVPSPLFLALLTFVFGMIIPGGPAILWISAAVWLFFSGKTGWSIFMVFYGFFIISSVDNFIRPYLISRESRLPFILVFLGVLGGLMAFGFIGIFLGPVLLVIGNSVIREWLILKTTKEIK